MANLIKATDGHVSTTKIGVVIGAIATCAMAIQQAGLDIIPSSKIDELIVKIVVICGIALGLIGGRDALSKVGK